MTTLVVQAHPLDESANAALLKSVCAGLDSHGIEHRVARLWVDKHPTATDVKQFERLVLVYPTWGGGQPAMLLDWLQRMLEAGGFVSIARLQAVTTHGSSKLVNRLQGEWGRQFLATQVAGACRPNTKLEWHALYKIDRRTNLEVVEFLDQTEQEFGPSVSPAT